jgi:hypothetical protein
MIAGAGMATVAAVGITITVVVVTMTDTVVVATTMDVAIAGNHPQMKSGA